MIVAVTMLLGLAGRARSGLLHLRNETGEDELVLL